MINISPAAASKITEILAEDQKEHSGLRVFVQGGGLVSPGLATRRSPRAAD